MSKPNVYDRFNLLVIEGKAFKKKLSDDENKVRYAFIKASRKSWFSPWEVSSQKLTSRSDNISTSSSAFDHGKTIKVGVDDDEAVLKLFEAFREECIEDGMDLYDREDSSYTYGLLIDDVVDRNLLKASVISSRPYTGV